MLLYAFVQCSSLGEIITFWIIWCTKCISWLRLLLCLNKSDWPCLRKTDGICPPILFTKKNACFSEVRHRYGMPGLNWVIPRLEGSTPFMPSFVPPSCNKNGMRRKTNADASLMRTNVRPPTKAVLARGLTL